MTNVWLIEDLDHSEVSVYSGHVDVAEIPFVKAELGYLEGAYEDERDEFISDLNRAVAKGFGEAVIEERVRATLTKVIE